jgi:predicted ATPase
MLRKIGVRNFKPFGEVESVRLAPITLVYGPNSSGKSSLVQSLLLMNQTLNGQQRGRHNDLITRGSMIDLGNFSSILHRHDSEKVMSLEYEFASISSNSINSRIARSNITNPFAGISLGFSSFQISQKHIFPVLSSLELFANNFQGEKIKCDLFRSNLSNLHQLDMTLNEAGEKYEEEDILDSTIDQKIFNRDGIFKFRDQPGLEKFSNFLFEYSRDYSSRRFSNSNLSRSQAIDDSDSILRILRDIELRRDRFRPLGNEFLPASPIFNEMNADDRLRSGTQAISEVLRTYDRIFRNSLGSLSYLGPLRTHPARHYLLDGVPGETVGTRGERAVQILFHDLEAGNGSSPMLTRLNAYCANFEIPYKFDLRNLGDAVTGDVIVLSLTDTRTNIRVGPADVGFGIGQLLPILIEGILVNERGRSSQIVCVEQPEIHLHPRLQAALADFFVDTSQIKLRQSDSRSSRGKSGSVQWILETHSEALMLRLQRRIREKQISHEDISVLYVDPRGDKGSIVQELRLDEDGEFIDLWPDGFFVESLSEVLGGR